MAQPLRRWLRALTRNRLVAAGSGTKVALPMQSPTASAHLARLRPDNIDSLTTSNIHQETLRELEQVDTCFILVAYPILTERGDLLDTRLCHAL